MFEQDKELWLANEYERVWEKLTKTRDPLTDQECWLMLVHGEEAELSLDERTRGLRAKTEFCEKSYARAKALVDDVKRNLGIEDEDLPF